MPRSRPRLPLVVAAVLTLALPLVGGCTANTVKVRGRVVKDGQPYKVDFAAKEPDTFGVDFVTTVDGIRYVLPAKFDTDGTFRVTGSDGRGVHRGQYKVTVLHSGYMGAGGDRFKERYTATKTPLTVSIAQDADLTIDVGAGTITAAP